MTKLFATNFILASCLLCSIGVFAIDPGSDSDDALKQTQNLLLDPAARKAAIGNDAKAQKADAFVDTIAADTATKEAIYALAADVFADLAKEANNDPQLMSKLLEEAQRDPASFAAKYFKGAKKDRLGAISQKVKTPGPGAKP